MKRSINQGSSCRILFLIRKGGSGLMMMLLLVLILLQFCSIIGVNSQGIDKDKDPVVVTVVDTKSPIVIQYEGDGRGNAYQDDTYFGYSLAYMNGGSGVGSKVKFEGEQSSDHGTLFIGAPNEKRLTKNSGTVWACKFSGDAEGSCSLLSTISEQKLPSESRRSPSSCYFPENETEQWIGGSLSASSKNRKLYACAPRWKRNWWPEQSRSCNGNTAAETAMIGACYFVSLDRDPYSVTLQAPLDDRKKHHYEVRDPRDGSLTLDYLYLYAEFGMSSHVTWTDNLLVGAPNVRKWAGSYIEYRGDTPTVHRPSDIAPHSLFGYSVTSGRTRGRSYYTAVGAPRSRSASSDNLRGIVVVYLTSGSVGTYVYTGKQFGSYFGYSVATADLNGDGYDELLVGAPCHTPDFKSSSSYSTGCVMVYDVSRLPDYRQPLIRLCTDPQHSAFRVTKGARFGSAIVNLGDINFDQKEDFAVGAPYDDDGIGTVFIYYGGHPLSDKPAQIIRGKDIIPNLRGFGSQLVSSGSSVDVDGNNTPDLAIGSFESRHVVVLRTRPVAKASLKITFHDAASVNHNGEIFKFLPNQDKLRVRICVAFRFSNGLARDNQLNLDTWLSFDVDRKEKRFEFENGGSSEQKHRMSATRETCIDVKLRTIQGRTIEDNENNIEFQATLWYNQTVTLASESSQPSILPITPQPGQRLTYTSTVRSRRSFDPYLPAPIPETKSELEKLPIASDNCDADGNPNCDPNLKLDITSYYFETASTSSNVVEPGKAPILIGTVKSLHLSVLVSNTRETAYRPALFVSFDFTEDFEVNKEGLRLEWGKFPGRFGQCKSHKTTTVSHIVRCSQPLQNAGKFEYNLKLDNLISAIKVKDRLTGRMNFTIEAFPEGQSHEKVTLSRAIYLEAKVEVAVEDEVPAEGQFEIDWKRNLVDFKQLYILKNTGFASTSSEKVKAEIWVPVYIHVNKNVTQVLGVVDPTNVDLRCQPDNFQFYDPSQELGRRDKTPSNPLGNATLIRSKSRTTRSTNGTFPDLSVVYPEDATLSMSSSDKIITLSGCDTEVGRVSSSCQKIICYTDLPRLESREINLQMYILPNATRHVLKEETQEMRVESLILVSYPGNSVTKKGTTFRKFIMAKEVEAWKYLLAAGVGALLFVAFAFCLYKCGFFRRKKQEQLQQLKRQTMALDMGAMMNYGIPGGGMEAEEVLDD